jgi:hypothetical protein
LEAIIYRIRACQTKRADFLPRIELATAFDDKVELKAIMKEAKEK